MKHRPVLSAALSAMIALSATVASAQEPAPVAQPAPTEGAPPPSDTPPAGGPANPTTPPPDPSAQPAPTDAVPSSQPTTPEAAAANQTAPAAEAAPAVAATPPAAVAPLVKVERAPLANRLMMDAVTGVAGAAVILVLGLGVATPLALLPMLLPADVAAIQPLGVPLNLLITGAVVAVVLTLAVVASAVVQRIVRPLLGPQPSLLGAVIGALFFGGTGAVLGMVLSFLVVAYVPEPLRTYRNTLAGGDINSNTPQALAITSALVVGMAVPLAALGAAIGGPISAEFEDNRAVEGAASGEAGAE